MNTFDELAKKAFTLPKIFAFMNGNSGNTGLFIVTLLSEDGFVPGSILLAREEQMEGAIRKAERLLSKLKVRYPMGVNFELVPWNYTMEHRGLQAAIQKKRLQSQQEAV